MKSETRHQARNISQLRAQRAASKATSIAVLQKMMQSHFMFNLKVAVSGYTPRVQPTKETAHLPRRLQNRSKYLGNGKLRMPKIAPMY